MINLPLRHRKVLLYSGLSLFVYSMLSIYKILPDFSISKIYYGIGAAAGIFMLFLAAYSSKQAREDDRNNIYGDGTNHQGRGGFYGDNGGGDGGGGGGG